MLFDSECSIAHARARHFWPSGSMSLRDFVTGGASCTAEGGGGAGPSNPAAGLADALLGGGSSKGQESLRELPGA